MKNVSEVLRRASQNSTTDSLETFWCHVNATHLTVIHFSSAACISKLSGLTLASSVPNINLFSVSVVNKVFSVVIVNITVVECLGLEWRVSKVHVSNGRFPSRLQTGWSSRTGPGQDLDYTRISVGLDHNRLVSSSRHSDRNRSVISVAWLLLWLLSGRPLASVLYIAGLLLRNKPVVENVLIHIQEF